MSKQTETEKQLKKERAKVARLIDLCRTPTESKRYYDKNAQLSATKLYSRASTAKDLGYELVLVANSEDNRLEIAYRKIITADDINRDCN